MGDIYALETPESVAIGYPVAGIGSRFLAAVIDSAALGLVVLAIAIVMSILRAHLVGVARSASAAVGLLIIFLVIFGYYIFFELIWNGQSPGKRLMGLRVIQISGYPVTPLAVLIRNVMRLVDFLPLWYGVGLITMIANQRSRRLGDLAAATIVVKEGRDARLRPAPAPTAAPFPSPYAASDASRLPGASVSRLTHQDEALIRDFLARRATLSLTRRENLARQIAGAVHARIGGDPPTWPEAYLEAALREREQMGPRWSG